ncbi:protein of unknown function [Bradyrhizobium sp. ORS 285]|nr:protein of unknown function [Bradyrhizobium sp. ORS 285]
METAGPLNSISPLRKKIGCYSSQTARRASLSHSVGQIRPCVVGQLRSTLFAVFRSLKGRFAIVTDRGAGDAVAGWGRSARFACGRTNPGRTVKPCGPDTPTLVSWSATMPMTGASKPGPLGEHGAAVKPIAQGRPVVRPILW